MIRVHVQYSLASPARLRSAPLGCSKILIHDKGHWLLPGYKEDFFGTSKWLHSLGGSELDLDLPPANASLEVLSLFFIVFFALLLYSVKHP